MFIGNERTAALHQELPGYERRSSGRGRQFVVTLEAPESPADDNSTPASLINYGAMSPFTYGAAEYAATHPATEAEVAPATASDSEEPTSEVDAYWAQFPKEVQALRDIPNRDDRIPLAWGLVQRGFTIDAEIMVLGSDPYETMLMRQQLGYTWTPAMGQPPIDVLPGLEYPGRAPYDPNTPRAGSIPVSLDFAKGLESTSPMYKKYELV